MENTRKKLSRDRTVVELAEEIIILGFLELKLAAVEIRRNIRSVEQGAVMMAVGGGLLLLAMLTFIATAVAILALFLPTWLAALIVALTLVFFGIAFLFAGLGSFKDFTLVPSETLQRVQAIAREYHKVSTHHAGHGEGAAPSGVPATPARALEPPASGQGVPKTRSRMKIHPMRWARRA